MSSSPLRLVSSLVVWTLLAALPGAAQAPPPAVPGLTARVDALSAVAGAPVAARFSPRTGLATFVATEPGAPIPARGVSAEARARGFISRQGELFGFAGPPELVTERVSGIDRVGMEHVRFQQTFRGVPVTGGEISVHLRGEAVVAAHARTLPEAALAGVSTAPTVRRQEVAGRVLAVLARAGIEAADVELSAPRLEILDRGHLGGPPLPPRLTWFVEATRIDLREYVWIDAHVGTVALRFSQLTDAKDRKVYDADDPGDGVYNSLPGSLVRSEGDGGDRRRRRQRRLRLLRRHLRLLLHGPGAGQLRRRRGDAPLDGPLLPAARASCPYANAFWNGTQMVYGEGFPAADDVDAHELTHAVTESHGGAASTTCSPGP